MNFLKPSLLALSICAIHVQAQQASADSSFASPQALMPFELELLEAPANTYTFETVNTPLGARTKMTRTVKTAGFYAHFPANPADLKGVIYFFHGGGGDKDTWVGKNVEAGSLVSDAVLQGYGVVIPESLDRETKGWYWSDNWHHAASPSLSQYDDENLIRVINKSLIERGRYIPSTPIYLAGASNGCRMAQAMGSRLLVAGGTPILDPVTFYMGERADAPLGPIGPEINVKAVAAYICKPDEDMLPGYVTPTIFNHGAHDANNPAQEVEAFRAAVQANQQAAGINNGTARNMTERSALRVDQLTRAPGISYAYARSLHRDMTANGLLSPQGPAPATTQYIIQLRMAGEIDMSLATELIGQVERANGGHSVDSQWHEETLNFFENWQ